MNSYYSLFGNTLQTFMLLLVLEGGVDSRFTGLKNLHVAW